jgi:hypothetical protein
MREATPLPVKTILTGVSLRRKGLAERGKRERIFGGFET